ncbi:MAG: right-handed parallel beta-helix repeat-containing protein [Planctomycetes bacterium]|nr:right-handed parallel beta-helix repeat-containing protein [Planctomycetota bacterium]
MYFLDSSHILHVAKTGNDSNSGHAGQYPVNLANDAKLTIGSAITAAVSGDTIILWPGDYAENVSFGSKALTIIGTSRNKSRVIPASGDGVAVADDSVLLNLAVQALGSDARGVSALYKTNVVMRDCDVYGNYEAIYGYGANSLFLRNCRFRGQYDGGNLDTAKRIIAEGCIFNGLGTYGTGVDCRGLYGMGIGTYSKCIFIAERTDTTSHGIAAAYLAANSLAVFKNCVLKATAGSGHTGTAYGILVNGSGAVGVLQNCIVSCASENASDGPHDLRQATGKLIVSHCGYETYGGTITHGGPKMNKAIKLLVNKAIQTKSSGKTDYYDDDGSSVLLTHTPTDSEAIITRTPS